MGHWYRFLGFSSWGQALEILIPVAMALMVLFTYQNAAGLTERFVYAAIVGLISWLLAWVVRWTFIWMGDVFKK